MFSVGPCTLASCNITLTCHALLGIAGMHRLAKKMHNAKQHQVARIAVKSCSDFYLYDPDYVDQDSVFIVARPMLKKHRAANQGRVTNYLLLPCISACNEGVLQQPIGPDERDQSQTATIRPLQSRIGRSEGGGDQGRRHKRNLCPNIPILSPILSERSTDRASQWLVTFDPQRRWCPGTLLILDNWASLP